MGQFLWYIPNTVEPGHRGDDTVDGWGSLDYSVDLAQRAEQHGWDGALIGTGWGRPDTFTVATAIAARTNRFAPLVAVRPGYWHPAHFASAAATLDRLNDGRLLVNIVSGADDPAAYGDAEVDKSRRYDRTREFIRLLRRLWREDDVTHRGEFYTVEHSSLQPRPLGAAEGRHPTLYFGGASAAAEQVAATDADVQLFWGGAAGRDRRPHRPPEVVVRQARSRARAAGVRPPGHHAGARHLRAGLARRRGQGRHPGRNAHHAAAARPEGIRGPAAAVRPRRAREVLDSCLYTTPSKYGGEGAGTTWLVGSAAEVAAALRKYADLGVSHFVLSDTPYKSETVRLGDELLPLLRPAVVGN